MAAQVMHTCAANNGDAPGERGFRNSLSAETCPCGGGMPQTIVIAGSLAQKPRQGGHTWVLLQYLLGFKRLGWRVLFLDQLECDMCRDVDGQPCSLDQSMNLPYFLDVMHKVRRAEEFSLTCDAV